MFQKREHQEENNGLLASLRELLAIQYADNSHLSIPTQDHSHSECFWIIVTKSFASHVMRHLIYLSQQPQEDAYFNLLFIQVETQAWKI